MKMYILLKNGEPFLHPILESNFLENFQYLGNQEYVEFKRNPVPQISRFEVFERTDYRWNGNVVEDVHIIRPMTAEEKNLTIEEYKQNWAKIGFKSWIFNEVSMVYEPPFPAPNDGKVYYWDGQLDNWVAYT